MTKTPWGRKETIIWPRHVPIYTQAVTSNKRAAQSKVVRMMIPGVGQKAGEMDPQKTQVGA